MATLVELDQAGALFKLDPQLGSNEQEWRMIYASPRLKDWLQGALLELGSTWNIELSPAEQLDTLAENYCSGRTLTFEHDFKPLRHIEHGVWELKTADVRIFGWFHRKDCFIGVCAESKERLKEMPGLYQGYTGEVVRFRDGLELDEPKFVEGGDPNDVVSDYTYP